MTAKDVICRALSSGKSSAEIHELLRISHPASRAAQSRKSCDQQVAWYKSRLKRERVLGSCSPLGVATDLNREGTPALPQGRPTGGDRTNGRRSNVERAAATSAKSTFYAQLIDHVFISEVLQEAWFGFDQTVEVLRSEVDSSGYDLVFECNGVLRYVQLKTSELGAKRQSVNINIGLSTKPGGCVIWLFREHVSTTRRIHLTYLFFGGKVDEMLPDLSRFPVGKHSKGDSTGKKNLRPSIRLVPKREFTKLTTVRELVGVLFVLSE